ncbi:HupE/UreJ family protein [Ciceribacter thiooxidans]|uniref:HupE/UreJ family protein n=1 Tax=Ciceribacter thiooxidans TaxID=1969821 RepID=A0ABV7HZP5_9HYPH|nr:HupE/UreJ family protein [Ciceribacter thiooxidans]
MKRFRTLALFVLAALPATAEAHTGVGLHSHGLEAGFSHPFTGLDHMLAMIGVGLWAASLGGRARYLVPLSFMGVMVAGGLLGITGIALPMVETLIAASVAAIGLVVLLNVRVPTPLAAAFVGACALFHGQAHGVELPAMANQWSYVAGFVLATGLLHAVGLGLGMARFGNAEGMLRRAAGGLVAVAGLALLAG